MVFGPRRERACREGGWGEWSSCDVVLWIQSEIEGKGPGLRVEAERRSKGKACQRYATESERRSEEEESLKIRCGVEAWPGNRDLWKTNWAWYWYYCFLHSGDLKLVKVVDCTWLIHQDI